MLMITFSPSRRGLRWSPSPYAAGSVTLPALASRTSFGLTAGSCIEHVEAGAADLAGFDQLVSVSSSITSPRAGC